MKNPDNARPTGGIPRGWAVLTAAVVGTAVWGETMGSAPRYSFGEHQDTGDFGGCLLGLALAALVLGALAPRSPVVVGAVVTAAPLFFAPGTAPRGDNDGLWTLVLPMLVLYIGATAFLAWVAAEVRQAIDRRVR